MASLFINEGATCPTCIYQEGALRKELDAVRQCKKCMRRDGRPGWDPKPSVRVEFSERIFRNKQSRTVRRVIP